MGGREEGLLGDCGIELIGRVGGLGRVNKWRLELSSCPVHVKDVLEEELLGLLNQVLVVPV